MNKVLKQSKVFLNRHGSTILTCVGSLGVVATSILTVKATTKAVKLTELAKEEKGEDLTKLEIVKVAGPAYIPAIVMGASTIACIFGANILNQRKQAALMSAYALLDNSYKEYKKKVTELYGKDGEFHVRESIAKDKYEEDLFDLEDDKLLFYDDYSERYFQSTMADVLRAEYEINRQIALTGDARLNDFYELLDIPQFEAGKHLGWSTGGLTMTNWSSWLDFEHEKFVLDDGLEGYIITFSVEPLYEYGYY